MEELRAKSGSINNTSQISAEPYSVVEKKSISEKLLELKKIHQEQLISDSEYETLKAKFINEL